MDDALKIYCLGPVLTGAQVKPLLTGYYGELP